MQRLGVGLDNIAMEAATARGAWVANVPDYCVEEVSDHAVALAYAWFRGIAHFDHAVKAGQWDPSGARLRRGATLTAGILGLGRIGRCTARKLAALGMTVLGHDIAAPPKTVPVRMVGLDRLAAEADIVIVHLPLTDETHHLVDAAFLAQLKPGAFLINVSRGPVVDNDALIAALDAGQSGRCRPRCGGRRAEPACRSRGSRGRDRDAARGLLLRRLAGRAQAARCRGGGARAGRRTARKPVQQYRLTMRGEHPPRSRGLARREETMSAPEPAFVDQAALDWEGGEDAGLATGTGIRWKLLVAGERTESEGLVTGIAEIAPGGELMRHHHEPAETYYILSGQGEMEIEGRTRALGPGSAVYIPPDARHAVRCTGAEPLVFVFCFPRDRFDQIVYHFDH